MVRIVCVFPYTLPWRFAATILLLRRRVRLSREVTDDIARARVTRVRQSFVDVPALTWSDGAFVDGVAHGPHQIWHSTGKLQSEHMYDSGRKQGITRWWDSDGTLREEIPYVRNLVHGVQRVYDSSGALFRETMHRHGWVHGIDRFFSSSGKIAAESTYVNGKMHGTTRVFHSLYE